MKQVLVNKFYPLVDLISIILIYHLETIIWESVLNWYGLNFGFILHFFVFLRLLNASLFNFEKLFCTDFRHVCTRVSLFENNNEFMMIIDYHDILLSIIRKRLREIRRVLLTFLLHISRLSTACNVRLNWLICLFHQIRDYCCLVLIIVLMIELY